MIIEDTKFLQERALWQNMALCANTGYMRTVLNELIDQMAKVNANSRLTSKSRRVFKFNCTLTYVLNSDASTESERLPPRSVPFPQSSTFELRPYGHCPNYTTGHVFICICFRFTLCSNPTLIYLLLSSCTLISISSMSS